MKICSKCGIKKHESEFRRSCKEKDNLQWCCKQCQRNYYDKYYLKNRKIILLKNEQYYLNNKEERLKYLHKRYMNVRDENLKFLLSYLKTDKISCRKCGYSKCFAAIHGHHVDPNKKNSKSDALGTWLTLRPKTFQNKIIKNALIFLCANCHIELHSMDKVYKSQ